LAAAEASGADAVHPGYGFLAENSAFARAVMAAGLIWIGPDPDSIDDMGDKERARLLAKAAGVPILPGSPRFARGELHGLSEAAEQVGFPLLVKASAGGGGIGMRRVDTVADLAKVVETTQTLAEKSFGDGAVYLERLVPKARHIEIQVFGFGDGRAVHLFERECSIQRRFQKIIEETPAPRLDSATVAEMARSAVALCRQERYRGAGTVEFVVDAETGAFYFLEMNTRIQVEHPVTEMVTSFDLVKEQIEVAAGAPISYRGDGTRLRGHAIECRINAEDPYRNFQPSPGLITAYHPPGGPGVRVDTHVYAGYTVPPYYDSLLAKVIVHGNTRPEALSRMGQALDSFILEGVTTTIPFLARVIRHPDFAAGKVDTRFLERESHLLQPD